MASSLEAAGVDFTVHVVGFGLSAAEGKQVACLAENTGGKYFSAGNAANLGQALTETVADAVVETPSPPVPPPPAPPKKTKPEKNLKAVALSTPDADPLPESEGVRFDVYAATESGHETDPIETGYGKPEFKVPAGSYVVSARKDLAYADTRIEVPEEEQTVAEIVLNAGYIHARALASAGVPAGDGVRWDVTSSAGETDTSYGPTRTILVPAGETTVAASLGAATASVPGNVEAGTATEVEVVLGSGRLTLRGKRSAEATDYDDGMRWDVTDASGKTETSYGAEANFDLPAGEYGVKATLGEASAEVRVAVAAGETVVQEVVVATGSVIAHALFAEGGPTVTEGPRFDVLSAEPGADGERKGIATTYNDGASFDLPPGKYVLRATSDEAMAEAGFELKAGEPLEVEVVLNAGLLAVTAPGADRIDLLGSKKDIYGKQKIISTRYGEDWSVTSRSANMW